VNQAASMPSPPSVPRHQGRLAPGSAAAQPAPLAEPRPVRTR
jgi:hypothetical protein